MSTSLATLPEISRALALITTMPEAKDLRDKAAAICRYAKESRQSLDIQNRAAYVKLLCERKAGALLLEVPKIGHKQRKGATMATFEETLKSLDIPEQTARRWQYLAQWPESELITLLEACNEDEDELTTGLAVSSARSFIESLKRQEKEQKDEQPEIEEATDEQASAPANEEQDEWQGEEQESKEVATSNSAQADKPPKKPTAIERERAERLIQLFDAACDLCENCPPVVNWISTMRKWQSKLNSQMER